jgi:flagellar protein FliT
MTDAALAYYESVAAASNDMLEAARRQDWEALAQAERRCAAVITVLKASGVEARLSDTKRQRKAEIIRRVLADDAEIRRLVDPRMRQLEHLLGSARTRQRVGDAYHV